MHESPRRILATPPSPGGRRPPTSFSPRIAEYGGDCERRLRGADLGGCDTALGRAHPAVRQGGGPRAGRESAEAGARGRRAGSRDRLPPQPPLPPKSEEGRV